MANQTQVALLAAEEAERRVDLAQAELNEANAAFRDARREYYRLKYGAASGVRIICDNKEYEIVEVKPNMFPWEPNPVVVARLIKKDGTPAKTTLTISGKWHLARRA